MPDINRAPPLRRAPRSLTPDEQAAREAFGHRLRQLRLAAGVSQEHLAELIEHGRNDVGRWERGERPPNLDTITRLAAALRVPPGRLFEPVDDET